MGNNNPFLTPAFGGDRNQRPPNQAATTVFLGSGPGAWLSAEEGAWGWTEGQSGAVGLLLRWDPLRSRLPCLSPVTVRVPLVLGPWE